MTNQITVRGLDQKTSERVRELARQRGISLNKAVIILIQRGAGTERDDSGPTVVGNALDAFRGSWSREEETELLASIDDLERIDGDLWK